MCPLEVCSIVSYNNIFCRQGTSVFSVPVLVSVLPIHTLNEHGIRRNALIISRSQENHFADSNRNSKQLQQNGNGKGLKNSMTPMTLTTAHKSP